MQVEGDLLCCAFPHTCSLIVNTHQDAQQHGKQERAPERNMAWNCGQREVMTTLWHGTLRPSTSKITSENKGEPSAFCLRSSPSDDATFIVYTHTVMHVHFTLFAVWLCLAYLALLDETGKRALVGLRDVLLDERQQLLGTVRALQ